MSDHGTPTETSRPRFSAAEWQELQAQDVHAGKAVVGLMVSIFSIGLLLYIGVMLSVM